MQDVNNLLQFQWKVLVSHRVQVLFYRLFPHCVSTA